MARQNEKYEIVQFKIKRHHLFAVVGLLAGLAAGYLIWGAPFSQFAAASTPAPQASEVTAQPTSGTPVANQVAPTDDIATQIESLVRYEIPIAENDPVTGPEDAPITIIEFADFQCPFCQRHFLETYPQLVAQYGDQIRFVYKDFPLTNIHPEAYPAAVAAQCALEQDKFWEYHDLLFGGGLELGQDAYTAYAQDLGLDMDRFAACVEEDRYAEDITADTAAARNINVGATPTFFINGIAIEGAMPFDVFAQIIDYELEHQSN